MTGETGGTGETGETEGEDRHPTAARDLALPARVRMPLLDLITQQSLDEDYLVAAERRASGVPRPEGRRSHRAAALMVAAFGLLVATAAIQTSQRSDTDEASRSVLIDSIELERGRVADQQTRAADLREDVAARQERLTETVDAAQRSQTRVRRLQTVTGFVPVSGPGLRVTVTESPDVAEEPLIAIKDSDLTLLTNGLWEAGAEAVAVNGQRVSSASAISTSGVAIEVNGIGVAPPYVVTAIGDRRTLAADLLDTSSGLTFAGLAEFYGFDYEFTSVASLDLAAAPSSLERLRSVEDIASTARPAAPGGGETTP